MTRTIISAAVVVIGTVTSAIPAVAQSAPTTESARCSSAYAAVRDAGFVLPPGIEYRCPGDAQTFPGDRQHWGVACYRQVLFCPNGAYIAINPSRIGPSDARMRYVVAHEFGHALDYVRTGATTEPSADAQAAAAGFPR